MQCQSRYIHNKRSQTKKDHKTDTFTKLIPACSSITATEIIIASPLILLESDEPPAYFRKLFFFSAVQIATVVVLLNEQFFFQNRFKKGNP